MPAVLYAEDEPTIRRVVQLWLGRHGITVHTAPGIRDACDILARERVDGVFIDAWLEDGAGLELYQWIRDERPALARRVAFVTGDTVGRATRDRLAATGCPVVEKPFDLDALKTIAASWVRGAGEVLRAPEARE